MWPAALPHTCNLKSFTNHLGQQSSLKKKAKKKQKNTRLLHLIFKMKSVVLVTGHGGWMGNGDE